MTTEHSFSIVIHLKNLADMRKDLSYRLNNVQDIQFTDHKILFTDDNQLKPLPISEIVKMEIVKNA